MISDELFMKRALELAQLGMGCVSPNPRVGCVVVRDNKIIGEGWHQKFGEAHAEVNAIKSVTDQSLLKGSTIYVNLEPCAHHGKTPPCVDLLIAHRVKRVVIANQDTHRLVNGAGIKKLNDAGIETTSVLQAEGRELNKRFFKFAEKKMPYIILKWAQTNDGFIARKNFDSKWISGQLSRQLVHRWRSEEDAVLVGNGTVMHDNPFLTVRDWSGRNPTRIVIDRFLQLKETLHIFDQQEKTICYNVLRHEEEKNNSFIQLSEENFLSELIADLVRQQIQSVMVEGGAQTIQLFIDANLWDEARVFTSNVEFGEGIDAPRIRGKMIDTKTIETDRLDVLIPLT